MKERINEMKENKATDFLVECANPKAFDNTIQQLGAAALIQQGDGYLKKDGYHVMRVFGDSGFVEFAIKNQGYGKVVKKLDQIL